MTTARVSIGVLARQSGCSVPTIRYYEDIGLLPAARRTGSGQRSYDDAARQRLAFIRRCRDFGFSLEQVRELLGLTDAPERPCADVRLVAAQHLAEVQRKRVDLAALEAQLRDIVLGCDAGCIGGPAGDCAILETLATPAGEAGQRTDAGCCG